MYYESDKNYFYKIQKGGGVKRVSKKKFKKQKQIKPKVGDKVIIIIKPYHKNITKTGIVKRVLTKKKYHSRGHKVMLKDNSVGRIIKLL